MKQMSRFVLIASALLMLSTVAWPQDSLNLRQIGQVIIPNGEASAVAVQGHFAYVAEGEMLGLHIYDVANPALPTQVGQFGVPDYSAFRAIVVRGNYAYLPSDWEGLRVVDVSNPAAPFEVGVYPIGAPYGTAYGVALDGDYAYIADGTEGLHVVNVSDPATPVETGSCPTAGFAQAVVVSGNYAYVADCSGGLRIIDINNPAAPVEVGFFNRPMPFWPLDVAVSGDFAYLADAYGHLSIINISNPAAPTETASWATPDPTVYGVTLSGNHAYVANYGGGLRVIDVNNPAAPIEDAFYNGPGQSMDVVVSAGYAYAAEGNYFTIYACSTGTDDPLPVELLAFTATPGDGRVSLSWRTASEQNNARFEIARDGAVVAIQESQGNSAGEQRYAWTDTGVQNGRLYHYTLSSVSIIGERAELQSAEAAPMADGALRISEYALHAAYPNPFNPSTTITYDLLEAGHVTLSVHNLMGQNVATLVNGGENAGRHTVAFDAAGLPSGMYLYRLDANGFSATQKMMLMK